MSIKRTGIIKLIDRFEECICSYKYHSPYQREKIIQKFKLMYADKYYKCYLQIEPYHNIDCVNKDGTNSKQYAGKKVKMTSDLNYRNSKRKKFVYD